jgi:hypothetical protein
MNDENLIPAKKGEVRNPKGKPKGTKNFKTLYKRYLNMKLKPGDSGFEIPYVSEETELTLKEMIVLRHIKKAIGKADYKDIEMIINRVDGLLKQQLEHSGKIEQTSDITTVIEQLRKSLKDDDSE